MSLSNNFDNDVVGIIIYIFILELFFSQKNWKFQFLYSPSKIIFFSLIFNAANTKVKSHRTLLQISLTHRKIKLKLLFLPLFFALSFIFVLLSSLLNLCIISMLWEKQFLFQRHRVLSTNSMFKSNSIPTALNPQQNTYLFILENNRKRRTEKNIIFFRH